MKKALISMVAYVAIVFPLALVWHLVLFEDRYHAFGYFDGEPNIPVGFLTMVFQGLILGFIYPMFQVGRVGMARAFKFAGLMGAFYWTCHVLALVAKQNVPDAGLFIVMETGYLMAQFGLFAVALGLIFGRSEDLT